MRFRPPEIKVGLPANIESSPIRANCSTILLVSGARVTRRGPIPCLTRTEGARYFCWRGEVPKRPSDQADFL